MNSMKLKRLVPPRLQSPIHHFRALLLLGTCVSALAHTVSQAAPPPNVVIILTDDLGYGDLGCYGHPHFATPRLDRMAAEGAKLTHFQSPMAFCGPTRAALLTGRYHFRSGMTGNPAPDARPESDRIHLDLSETTLGQVFQEAGHATALIGKWHLGHAEREWLPPARGFDEFFGIAYSNDMRPVELIDGDEVVEYPLVQATLTRRLTDRALAFIDDQATAGRPFFLYLAHPMPHKPLAVSEAFYQKSGHGLYADTIAELDASTGAVLDKLAETGLDERTLVIFTSDNGPWFGGSSGGLRGMKGSTYEGGWRVPLIARWPGRIPAGHVSDELSVIMDLFPTALAAAGIAPPDNLVLDGRDILPLLASAAPSPHAFVIGNRHTIRDARWKLHVLAPINGLRNHHAVPPGERWIDPRGPDGVTILAPYEQYDPSHYPSHETGAPAAPMQLFDLRNDPGEQHDLAEQHPEIVERLKAAFEHAFAKTP
jgi:arylsulfatase A-like enzyme